MPRSLSRTPPMPRLRRTCTPQRTQRLLMTPPLRQGVDNDFETPVGTISQITAREHSPNTVIDTMSSCRPDDEPCCALCQMRLIPACTSPASDVPWRWPCNCGVQLHVGCAVQVRLRSERPSAYTVARLGPELSLTRLCHVLVVWPASPSETLGSHSLYMMRNCLILVLACQLRQSVFLYCVVPGCPPSMCNFTRAKQNGPPHDAFR